MNNSFNEYSTQFWSELYNASALAYIREKVQLIKPNLLEDMKFLALRKTGGFYGVCELPKIHPANNLRLISGYRIRCAINVNLNYPYHYTGDLATNKDKKTGLAKSIERGERFQFFDINELSVWLAGRTTFRLVQHLNNGVTTEDEPHANSMGKEWLLHWRRATCSKPLH